MSIVGVLVTCLVMYVKGRGVRVLVGLEHGVRPREAGRRSERRDGAA
jgi:hypothetical protein